MFGTSAVYSTSKFFGKKSANFENRYSGVFDSADSEYNIHFSIRDMYEALYQDIVNFTKDYKIYISRILVI